MKVTKIIIPVIDTESGVFEYKGRQLTREEFSDMEWEHFLRTNRQVQRFTDNIRQGISNFDSGYSGRMKNVNNEKHADIIYNEEEAECIVLNSKREDVDEAFFEKHVQSGKMFILIMNFNPDTMSGDAKSEMLFWMEESRRILSDMTINDELKLKTLPTQYFYAVVGDKEVFLSRCKIVQNYSTKKNPFNFGIIVEKATYTNGK